MIRPVIVLGTGRSGTSTVARVCHKRLGICMGHYLKEANDNNPKGFYEDWLCHSLIKMHLEKVIQIDELFRMVAKSHAGCSSWGFKDPWWMFLTADAMNVFNPRLIVITQRNRKATMASWKKTRLNWAKAWNLKPPVDDPDELDKLMTKEFNNLLDQRLERMEFVKKVFPGRWLSINIDEKPSDEYIERTIRGGLQAAA